MQAGHGVQGFDVSAAQAETLAASGGRAVRSVQDAAGGVEILITMLPAGQHVREVYLGAAGVLAAAGADCVDVAFGLGVADDEQPARRTIMMTNAARAGVPSIPRARRRAPAGICGDMNSPRVVPSGLLTFMAADFGAVTVMGGLPRLGARRGGSARMRCRLGRWPV